MAGNYSYLVSGMSWARSGWIWIQETDCNPVGKKGRKRAVRIQSATPTGDNVPRNQYNEIPRGQFVSNRQLGFAWQIRADWIIEAWKVQLTKHLCDLQGGQETRLEERHSSHPSQVWIYMRNDDDLC